MGRGLHRGAGGQREPAHPRVRAAAGVRQRAAGQGHAGAEPELADQPDGGAAHLHERRRPDVRHEVRRLRGDRPPRAGRQVDGRPLRHREAIQLHTNHLGYFLGNYLGHFLTLVDACAKALETVCTLQCDKSTGGQTLFRSNVTTIPALNREFVPEYFCHPVPMFWKVDGPCGGIA